jgi:hypothetical protein
MIADSDGPTELLIVGVAHLDHTVPDSALDHGFDCLKRWKPDALAIEHLPGHLVIEYEQRGGAYEEFPVGGAPLARHGAATVAGLRPWNVWQAKAIARGRQRSVQDRVLGWLLAREPCNALLLPWNDANLPATTVAFLTGLEQSPSERVRVGVRLARHLGHSELVHFDDHTGVELLDHLPNDWDTIATARQQAHIDTWPQPQPPFGIDDDQWLRWTWSATPEFREWVEQIESGGADGPDDTGVLRARLAQWRSRNLAMAAHLRAATGMIPGGRMLAIVGSSHERPLRAALTTDQHDLVLTDITRLDRDD